MQSNHSPTNTCSSFEAAQKHLLKLRQDIALVLEEGSTLASLLQRCLANHIGADARKALGDVASFAAKLSRQAAETPEVLLAVSGVMKAGKSTTINALVGAELIPSRNMPMTAVPTRVRHVPGMMQPRLTIPSLSLWQRLLNELRPSLLQQLPTGEELYGEAKILKDLADWNSVPSVVTGASEVAQTLARLHDLARHTARLKQDFPWKVFCEPEQLPLVEASFALLPENLADAGTRITLLDTPGGNEDGQEGLKELSHYWLSHAAGVLLIIDYTQTKTDAEEELRKTLAALPFQESIKIYVLVNKFDEFSNSGGSLDAKEIVPYVTSRLLHGLAPLVVRPAASRPALLATMASLAIRQMGRLPDVRQHPWVKDFARQVYPASWENKLQDAEDMEKGARWLSENSLLFEAMHDILAIECRLNQIPLTVLQGMGELVLFFNNVVESFHAGQTSMPCLSDFFARYASFSKNITITISEAQNTVLMALQEMDQNRKGASHA